MTREIKFRGLRVDGKGFVYGDIIQDNGYYYIYEHIEVASIIINQYESTEVYPDSIGQATGCYDKNGYMIYEGDIVDSEIFMSKGQYAKCKGIIKYKGTGFLIDCEGEWQGSHAEINSLERIKGNIHQNK